MNIKLLLCKLGFHKYERKINYVLSEISEGLKDAIKKHFNIPIHEPLDGQFSKAVSVTYRCIICEKIKIEKFG